MVGFDSVQNQISSHSPVHCCDCFFFALCFLCLHTMAYTNINYAPTTCTYQMFWSYSNFLIIVVKHAQAQTIRRGGLILICRNETARKFSVVRCVYGKNARRCTCVGVRFCCAPTLFSLWNLLCNREDRYTEAAKVNMNTQNAMARFESLSLSSMHRHTHTHIERSWVRSNLAKSGRYLISFIANDENSTHTKNA